jgi:hypothetical protein
VRENKPNVVSALYGIAAPLPLSSLQRCTHDAIVVHFDKSSAMTLTSLAIRSRWPRFTGRCPQCGASVIKYASFEHYTMGDW